MCRSTHPCPRRRRAPRAAAAARRRERTRLTEERSASPCRGVPLLYRSMTAAELRTHLARFPIVPFVPAPSLVEPLPRLAAHLGTSARLLVKRDDAIAFGWGGNK